MIERRGETVVEGTVHAWGREEILSAWFFDPKLTS